MRRLLAVLLLGMALNSPSAFASSATEAAIAADPVTEKRLQKLSEELRCLVCQNQTLAESTAPLAQDLKQQVRELIAAGKTDDEVLAHLTDRYGDFVRYKPPLKASTWLLWAGPALLFVLGLGLLVRLVRQRARLPDEAFDEEPRDGA